MNEIDKFFGDLPSEDTQLADIFGQTNNSEGAPAQGAGSEKDQNGGEGEGAGAADGATERKNRRHRRLEEQLQRERDSNIALNARIQTLSETNNSSNRSQVQAGQMPQEWIDLYGDTPESKKAWAMQERMILNLKEDAKREAVAEIQAQNQRALDDRKQFESVIENELEAIEDAFDVDLTSDSAASKKHRNEFLKLVQKLSPKNERGEVTSYVDFTSAYELYQQQQAKAPAVNPNLNRQKEIAGRSMQESGQGNAQQRQTTPGFRGWERDMNLTN